MLKKNDDNTDVGVKGHVTKIWNGAKNETGVTTFTSFDAPGRGFALRMHTITLKFQGG